MDKTDIIVTYGRDGDTMANALCEAAGLDAMIGARARRVMLKPNLVTASPASDGATTHPELVRGVLRYLRERGFCDVVISEGSWVGDSTASAFKACGYEALAREFGVPLIDTQKHPARRISARGFDFAVSACYASDVFLINLPVMKGHCQTVLTCALKNMKGLITDAEKRRFHTMGLHRPIAALNAAIRQDFILVDALCGDLDFEEGGNPVPMDMAFAARDPVLCDVYACGLCGIAPDEVDYIGIARRFGVGNTDAADARVLALNDGSPAPVKLPRKAQALSSHIDARDACSACYGGLVRALSRMDGRDLPRESVCIGQGFRGVSGGIGVGTCTAGCKRSLAGCPPSAADIQRFLASGRSG